MNAKDVFNHLSAAFLDPASSLGTARWVALGLTAYDVIRNNMNGWNGGAMLLLAGIEIAGRWFNRTPMPPTMPPAVPTMNPPVPA
ncbi:hypothetical protein [Geothrix campi]|uniref:hypothetical protein n=1 Tax=Geothrix campi TaxID=2966450 RepID=UPI0021485A9D|nr:hypothetical protein [Geothrix sp. SG10]